MKGQLRLVAVGVLVATLILAVVPSSALAYGTDFDSFDPGTLAEDLSVPGVTFSSSPAGAFFVIPGDFMTLSGNVLLDMGQSEGAYGAHLSAQPRAVPAPSCYGNSLQLNFASVQSNVSFKFATEDESGALIVTGFNGGGSVYSNTFTATVPTGGWTPEGVASFAADVDAVTLSTSTGCFAIDDLSTIEAGAPGPDMVYIPPTAVVGRFVKDTPIYTAPDYSMATTPNMTAGMSVWVYGVDESGQFYLVMFAGSFFWVPVDTIGPNYDEVWHGRPLPNTITGGPGSGKFEGGPGSGKFEGGPGSGKFE